MFTYITMILISLSILFLALIFFLFEQNREKKTKIIIKIGSIEIKKEENLKENCKYKDCDINYLPTCKRYYPRYKGKYLYEWSWGKIDLSKDIYGGQYFYDEESAKRLLDKWLEYYGDVPSKIIKLC